MCVKEAAEVFESIPVALPLILASRPTTLLSNRGVYPPQELDE
jgi:hypothetical protein